MISDKHTEYMIAAIREAKKAAALGEVPVGAIVVSADGTKIGDFITITMSEY